MRRPWIALAALLAACGSVAGNADSSSPTAPTPPRTVPGVGALLETVPATVPPVTKPLVEITRPLAADGEVAALIGDLVGGNRLLMIGDSIFAGVETRYGGEMCAGLEPLGWAVEVAAEAGRFVEFGVEVVRRLVPQRPVDDGDTTTTSPTSPTSPTVPAPAGAGDWDAAAVFLGSNYNGDQADFDTKMRIILDRLAPRPTLLYTVTEYRPNYTEVAEVIAGLAEDYPNVTVIDWASAARTPGVLRPDGLHPNDAGEQVLVDLTAAALGEAPAGEPDCIRSSYRDDSAINAGNGTPNTGSTTDGTTTGGTSGGSTSGSGSSSTGGSSTSTTGSTTRGGSSTTTTTTPGGTTSGTTGGTTSGTTGGTTSGTTSGTTGGTTSGTTGSTTSGGTTGSTTSGGTTSGGTTSGGTSSDGTTSDGTTGATTGGLTTGGVTTGGLTTG